MQASPELGSLQKWDHSEVVGEDPSLGLAFS